MKKEEMKKLMKINEKNLEKQKCLKSNSFSCKENEILFKNNQLNSKNNCELLKKKRVINIENISNNGTEYKNKIIPTNANKIKNCSKNFQNKTKMMNDITFNDIEVEIDYLTKNMEFSCFIEEGKKKEKENLKNIENNLKQNSPLRYCFEQGLTTNHHINNICKEKNISRSKSKRDLIKSNGSSSLIKNSEFKSNRKNIINNERNTFKTLLIKDNKNIISVNKVHEINNLKKSTLTRTFTHSNLRTKVPNIKTFESIVNNL